MQIDKNLKRPHAFQRILKGQNSHIQYKYIIYMYMGTKILCHRNEGKKFKSTSLKVASANISCSTIHDCIPLLMATFLFVIELLKVSLLQISDVEI